MRKNRRFLLCALAQGGVLLALVWLSLLLMSVTAPAEGQAAPASIRDHSVVAPAAIEATTLTTNTIFLPLVNRQEATLLNVWQGEYYDNPSLIGDPQYIIEEARIDYDWGEDGPPDLGSNYFSIRWTGIWDFEAGEYTLSAYADDGLRLWLDDDLLVDAWTAGMGDYEATVTIETAGLHYLKLEYFERTGDAAIQLHWRRTDLYPQWHGDYYGEPWVEGGRQYAQKDSVIQFDWGEGCPDRLSPHPYVCNRFSIGWAAEPLLELGTHRILLYADEGYQLFIDGNKVQEAGWDLGPPYGAEDDWYDLHVAGTERHEITYNFHDQGGPAEARLWIENLAHTEWTAQYFDNPTLTGAPMITQTEPAVFYDWGLGKPRTRPRLPSANGFSVRWSGPRYFHSGFYRFGLFADDGVRLSIDGELLVNEWHAGRGEYHSRLTYLGTGYHDVVIEYFEYEGEAEIRFWWE